MLAIPVIVIATVFVLSLSWLAYIVIRQRHVAQDIRQAVHDATEQDINDVYGAVEQMGDGRSKAYILGRTGQTSSLPGNRINLPQALAGFPWAGKSVYIDTANGVNLVIEDKVDLPNRLRGNVYTSVPAPLADNERGQGYTLFSPYKWLVRDRDLLAAVRKISRRFPEQVLSYLVTTGKDDYHYEPAHQVRIGDGLNWAHKPQVPVCDICEERMQFVLQVPGTLLDGKAEPEAIYYLFGCNNHPGNTASVTQFQ